MNASNMRVILIICLFAQVFSKGERFRRMINGKIARDGQFPWMVYIWDGKAYCSGILISRQAVLTAGHCIKDDIKTYVVEAGVTYGSPPQLYAQRFKVVKAIRHPNFKYIFTVRKGVNDFDLGILILNKKANLTRLVKPICLQGNKNKAESQVTKGIGIGFGTTSTRDETLALFLRYFELDIQDRRVCEVIGRVSGHNITQNQICTASVRGGGNCFGDSGGSLVYKDKKTKKYVAIGIMSQSVFMICDQALLPEVYVALRPFKNWIVKNVGRKEKICFV